MLDFKNKFVVITGGAGHLGSCLAEALIVRGAHVALLDRDQETLTECQNKLPAGEGQILPVAVDLGADDAPIHVKKALSAWDRIDVIIHAAAFVGTSKLDGWAVPFERQMVATWEAALKVNLTAIFAINQALVMKLRKSACPAIVHISSIYGIVGPDYALYEGIEGMGNPAAYAASKGGLDQLTRWMATSLAPQIRVNGVNVGGIYRAQDQRFVDRYSKRVPLARMASEQDVVGPVLFLASEDAAYITGQNLPVDGGYTII